MTVLATASDGRPTGTLMAIVRKAGAWTVTIVATLAILAVVALMVGPRLLGWQGVIVLSGSMEPTLKVGGLAFVEPEIDTASIHTGDIIMFRATNGQRVSHRVVEVVDGDQGRAFRTKGDANDDADPELVSSANVLGRVRFHLPYLGYAAEKLRDRRLFYAIIGLPAGLLIICELLGISKQLRREGATP